MPDALKQLILDKMGDELSTQKHFSLNPSEPVKMGASQRAEELGFKVTSKNRGSLGKFVKAQGLQWTEESRLCNGQSRLIKVYEVNEALDAAITAFFDNL